MTSHAPLVTLIFFITLLLFPHLKESFLHVVGFGVFPVPFSEGSSVPVTILKDQGVNASWGNNLYLSHEDVMGSLEAKTVSSPSTNHSPLNDKLLMTVPFAVLSFKLLNFVVVEVLHV